jgi:hypothetical protein
MRTTHPLTQPIPALSFRSTNSMGVALHNHLDGLQHIFHVFSIK